MLLEERRSNRMQHRANIHVILVRQRYTTPVFRTSGTVILGMYVATNLFPLWGISLNLMTLGISQGRYPLLSLKYILYSSPFF